MHCWLLLLILLMVSPAMASNSHGVPDTQREMQAWFGDALAGYVHSGCLPAVPASSLTLASVDCAGYVRGASGELVYVSQAGQAVGPLDQGDGLYFLAVHRLTGTAVPAWQRQAGSHYVWQKAASPPALAEGLVVAQVTVAGGSITAVQDRRIPGSYVKSGVYDPTDPLYGGVCDGVTQAAAAVQAAINAAPAGAKVQLPAGVCLLNQTLNITRSLSLGGAGMDHTYLKQTVTNIPVLTVSAVNVHVIGMTLMHATFPVAGGDGLIVRYPTGESLQGVWLYDVTAAWNYRGFVLGCMTYGAAHQVNAYFNNSHGFEFLYEAAPGCGVDQWDLYYANSTLNKGSGFFGYNAGQPQGLGPWLTSSLTFGNDQGGFRFVGTPGNAINDIRIINAISSADNVAGIYLDTYGGSHIISEPWIEYTGSLAGFPIGFDMTTSTKSDTGSCLALTLNNGSTTITGGLYWNCAWSGVALYASFSTLTGGSSMGNGQAMDPDLAKRAGVAIGGNGVGVSNHRFTSPGATTLHYIYLTGTIDNLAIGINTYSNELSPPNFILSGAALPNLQLPVLVVGASVHTNTGPAQGFQLYDATNSANPLKLLRVSSGSLEVLNSAKNTVIQGLSDQGTPSWPARRGQIGLSGGATTAVVPLAPAEPDGSYFVQLTPVQTAGTPPAGAYTINNVTKAAGTFTISVLTAPGAGNTVVYDWFVYR